MFITVLFIARLSTTSTSNTLAPQAPPYLAEAALPDGPQDLEVVEGHCGENRGVPGEGHGKKALCHHKPPDGPRRSVVGVIVAPVQSGEGSNQGRGVGPRGSVEPPLPELVVGRGWAAPPTDRMAGTSVPSGPP